MSVLLPASYRADALALRCLSRIYLCCGFAFFPADAQECFMDSEEDDFHGPKLDFRNAHRRASCANKERTPIVISIVIQNKKEFEVRKKPFFIYNHLQRKGKGVRSRSHVSTA